MKFKRQIDLPYPQPWEYVYSLLGNNKVGFFVDVGAYDGIVVTNTHFFEDVLNWSGICIEPNPNAFSKLVKSRDTKCYNFGISDVDSKMTFRKVNGHPEMLSGFLDYLSPEHISRINYEVSKNQDSFEDIIVETRRLDHILRENNITHIDYLSIDTEGNEFRVINSINFEECFIKIISAENNDKSTDVRNLIESKGFKHINEI
jgi:FkbM family methyltransferase